MSWNVYFRDVRGKDYGDKIKVPKSKVGPIPSNFESSVLSIKAGAEEVYREKKAKDSIQIREYENHYTLQLDKYNPQHHPLAHAVVDATGYTLAATAGAVIVAKGGDF